MDGTEIGDVVKGSTTVPTMAPWPQYPCPTCGRCPTCGHYHAQQFWPQWVYLNGNGAGMAMQGTYTIAMGDSANGR